MPVRAADESIYNLLPASTSASATASPLYQSKHPHSTPPTASTFGASIATATVVTNCGGNYHSPALTHDFKKQYAQFGPKDSARPVPADFQAAHTHSTLRDVQKYEYEGRRKAALDTKGQAKHDRKERNFIAENTTKAVNSAPNTATAASLGPFSYRTKPDYGQVPAYLDTVKAAVEEEKEMIASLTQPAVSARGQLLSESERVGVLTGLKQRWEELMGQYQVLTHMTSNTLSMGNLKRKEELERKLSDVEKAIRKMDKQHVMVLQ